MKGQLETKLNKLNKTEHVPRVFLCKKLHYRGILSFYTDTYSGREVPLRGFAKQIQIVEAVL